MTFTDTTTNNNPLTLSLRTNLGYVRFNTSSGNKYEVVIRLKRQISDIKWVDVLHARYIDPSV